MAEEEVKEIIERCTDEGFTIIRVEQTEAGETRAIIKIDESGLLPKFVRDITENEETKHTPIKRASGIDYDTSSAFSLSPLLLIISICLCN